MDVAETIETYVRAWCEVDADMRRATLETCWADDGVYEDPMGRAEGRAALVAHIGATQSPYPGMAIVLASAVDAHHDALRFGWRLRLADGGILVKGVDFGLLAPDGRLQRITGFFGPLPAA